MNNKKSLLCAIGMFACLTGSVFGQEKKVDIRLSAEGSFNANAKQFKKILSKKASFNLKKYPVGFITDRLSINSNLFSNNGEVKEWAKMGCTFMQSPQMDSRDPKQVKRTQKLLEWCEKYGIKLQIQDRAFYGKPIYPDYRKNLKKAIEYFSGYSSFAGFVISDEPGKQTIDHTLKQCQMHEQLYPSGMSYVNFGFEPAFVGKKTWEDYFDSVIQEGNLHYLSYDIYVQMLKDSKIPYYFMVMKKMREASIRNGVPFWMILLGVGHMHFRCPTFDEIRWQFNTAICAGASGVQWFFYYMGDTQCANYRLPPIDINSDKSPSWWNFRRVQLAFHNHYGNLFNSLASTRVTHYPKIVAQTKWTPNSVLEDIITDVPDHPLMIGEFIDKNDRKYVMVVNTSMKKSVAVTLVFPHGAKIYHYVKGVEYEGRALEHGGAIKSHTKGFSIKHWLAPGQEVVYRVKL